MKTPREIVRQAMQDLRVSDWRLRRGAKQARYEAIIARRKLVRQAFDAVRHSSELQADRDTMLAALTGPSVPEPTMRRAREILAERK